jgi:ring-1,2-phenylacetyl-CoA epoxidase subunit PaaD
MVMPQAANQNEPVRAAGAGGASIERARAALDQVTDPELPFLTIADMGILRDVRERDGLIEVDITPTYSGCPATDVIRLEVEVALAKAGVEKFTVRNILSPAWTTDWLSAAARQKLAAHGIAPPVRAAGKRALFSAVEVACPACGSATTERISEFGSTACKALYRCRTCREPFEYFKCI